MFNTSSFNELSFQFGMSSDMTGSQEPYRGPGGRMVDGNKLEVRF